MVRNASLSACMGFMVEDKEHAFDRKSIAYFAAHESEVRKYNFIFVAAIVSVMH